MAKKKKKRTASQVGKSNVSTSKAHERRVAKLFTEWSGSEFRRRRHEGRGVDTIVRDLTGDVIPVDRMPRFNIEAKKGAGFSFNAMLAEVATNKFTTWWHQSSYDAQLATEIHKVQVLPLVIFKPHPNHDFIAFDVAALKFLRPPGDVVPDTGCAQAGTSDGTPASSYGFARPWFPCLLFDEYSRCGPITKNVSHTKNSTNKVMVPLELSNCYITRWRTFAEAVDPETFFHGDRVCVAADQRDQSE